MVLLLETRAARMHVRSGYSMGSSHVHEEMFLTMERPQSWEVSELVTSTEKRSNELCLYTAFTKKSSLDHPADILSIFSAVNDWPLIRMPYIWSIVQNRSHNLA